VSQPDTGEQAMEICEVLVRSGAVDVIGSHVRVKVVKNKVAPPFKQAEFDIMFGKGISKSGGVLDLGVDNGFVSKTGTWFTYGETRLGQGRENAKQYLDEHPEVMAEIEGKVRGTMSNGAAIPIAVGVGHGSGPLDDEE